MKNTDKFANIKIKPFFSLRKIVKDEKKNRRRIYNMYN